MQGLVKRATDAWMPKKKPVRYGVLERKDGIVRTFEGVSDSGYREDLGGSIFYVTHAQGTYELAAEKLAEFQTMESQPDAQADDASALGGD